MQAWALVTGGAKRIGKEIVKTLHAKGLNIGIHCCSSVDAAKQLANECNSIRHNSAKIFQADLSDEAALSDFAQEVKEQVPTLTVLVNNASLFYPMPLESVTLTQAKQVINTNLLAPYFLSRDLSCVLKANQGCVINLLDIHGKRPLLNHGVYSIAKAGLEMATLSLAQEMAPEVRVNGVAPGAIIWPQASKKQTQQAVTRHIPLGRCGHSQDIAQLVAFLINAPYISGQIIAVDGGRSATGYLGAD